MVVQSKSGDRWFLRTTWNSMNKHKVGCDRLRCGCCAQCASGDVLRRLVRIVFDLAISAAGSLRQVAHNLVLCDAEQPNASASAATQRRPPATDEVVAPGNFLNHRLG
jgi:hypothetical protein